MQSLNKLVAALPRYRKALAAASPLVIEVVGQFAGVGSPLYVKLVSLVAFLAVTGIPNAPKSVPPALASVPTAPTAPTS